MPDLTPVSMAMYMLSPVITFGLILDAIILEIVYEASGLSSFSKAINPIFVILDSYRDLSPDKYRSTSDF